MTTIIYYLHKGDNIPFYIGKTINPKDRKYQHKNTFGKDTILEEIDEVPTDNWLFWETFYISLFKSWGFNLQNQNDGGGGSIGGYKLPTVSLTHKGRKSPNENRGKKILQYDLEGNFIKEWPNTIKASQSVSVSDVSIDQCLKGKSKKSAGYIWKYWVENYSKQLSKEEVEYINKPTQGPKGQKLNTGPKISQAHKGKKKDWISKLLSKPVSQYTKDGVFVATYPNLTEAAKAVGGYVGNICNVCQGNKKSSAGYIWKYLSPDQ
jgi:hypothetical protein